MTVRWSSLITTPDGEVDRDRLKTTVAVLLALLGGLLAIGATVVELVVRQEIPHNALLITVGALVVPLTGGMVTTGLRKGTGG